MLTIPVTETFQVPAGVHPARVVWLVDLGLQPSFDGTKTEAKILVAFEFPTEILPDGRPAVMSRTYTAKLSPKAGLRALSNALIGALQVGTKFSLPSLVGKPCMVTIKHTPRDDGGVRAKIESVAPAGKFTVPEMIGPSLVYDLGKPDPAVLSALPEWIQAMVAEAKVPTPVVAPTPAPAPAPRAKKKAVPASAETADFDDDLEI